MGKHDDPNRRVDKQPPSTRTCGYCGAIVVDTLKGNIAHFATCTGKKKS